MRTIHITGDSHAQFCFSNSKREQFTWENSPYEYKNNLWRTNPASTSTFGINKTSVSKFLEDVKEKDIVCFIYGEIDVRYASHQHIQKNNMTIGDMAKSISENYEKTVKELCKNIKNIGIISLVPQQVNTWEAKASPHDRVLLQTLLNAEFERMSLANGWKFINITKIFSDENGFMKKNCQSPIIPHIDHRQNDICKDLILDKFKN